MTFVTITSMSPVPKNIITIGLLVIIFISIVGYVIFRKLPETSTGIEQVNTEVVPEFVETLNEEKIQIERSLLPKDAVFINVTTASSSAQIYDEDSLSSKDAQENESEKLIGTVVASEVVQVDEGISNILPVAGSAYITDGAIALASPITVRSQSTTSTNIQETTEVSVDYIDPVLELIVGFSRERNEKVKIWSKNATIFINGERAALSHVAVDDILVIEGIPYFDSNEISATKITVIGMLEFLPAPQMSTASEVPS